MKFLKEFYCDYFIFNSSSMPGLIKTFILWLTLTVAFQANAQQKIEDSSQLNQWIKEGLNMESVNSDSALLIYKKVIRQAEKINYQPALAKGYHYAGIMYAVNGNMDSAMLYYNNAVSLYRRLNDLSSLGRTYMNIANIYQYKGEWGWLDQMIVSRAMLNGPGINIGPASACRDERLFFKHPKYGLSPDKSYSGGHYKGGYSDHLPVVARWR